MNSMAIQTNCSSIDLDSVISKDPIEPVSPSLQIKQKVFVKRSPQVMSIEESTARIALRMQERIRKMKESPRESSPVPQGT
jgi:hypothetical protein